ncbi:MAG: hypothetical protein KAQ79_20535, partial [Cyclobacteriaceae bacterium]|nr:hypothetical protein [Cyclobacteriaceae bacterium]
NFILTQGFLIPYDISYTTSSFDIFFNIMEAGIFLPFSFLTLNESINKSNILQSSFHIVNNIK